MTRFQLTLAAVAVVLAGSALIAPAPAQAGTSVSVSFDDGDRHHDRHDRRDWNRRDHHWPRYHSSYYGPHHSRRSVVRHVYLPPVYVPPAPRVVYAQPVRYVSSSVLADQSSPTYTNRYGQLCREYQTSAWIGGSLEETYGTACMQRDGAWRVVD